MRVRITRKPTGSYLGNGDSLRVGRVYDLDSALAAALMSDGYAELYDTLSEEQKRDRLPKDLWEATERKRPFPRPDSPKTNVPKK
jgi:hypothetical protein